MQPIVRSQFESSSLIAAVFIGLIVVVAVVALVVTLRRSSMTPFQWLLWIGACLLCKLLWRTRWLNELPLAANQGGIIACNHRSSVDPFFVQTATTRKMHWMVAREYCQHPAFRWFLSSCEVIPVGRGGIDTAATKAAIRLAASGEIVGMLPEGRINMSEELMLPARPGAALVALKAGVPIVPCYIRGAPYRRYPWSPLLMPAHVEVRFGAPIDPTRFGNNGKDENAAQEITREILKAIAALADQADFEPQIAGRVWKPTEQELEAAMDAQERRRAG
jgi:1-acyl-sn-glycerol-3-phosphate acyltransferase